MFEEKETLIVVYKDEQVVNLLRKLVEENGDPIQIVPWTEKVWQDQKKSGNIDNKILFIGKVKGIDSIRPLVNIKYDKWGIEYGWAGKQATLVVSSKNMKIKESRDFQKMLPKVPELAFLNRKDVGEVIGDFALETVKVAARNTILLPFKKSASDEIGELTRERYLYGVVEFYRDHLKEYMGIE